ncbi:MAG: alpha/beta fold hydrolase [Deltaproteobacteria bacterium]|nr:alpha/beta fold hydrolase [Deltaproteobacteria bacterium]
MTLVALHGFLGSPEAWAPLATMMNATMHIPYLPGHGPRPWFPEAGGFDAAVDALVEALPPGRVRLVGYSLGARLALGLLARHPSRVEGAALVGVDPGMPEGPQKAARRALDEDRARALEAGGVEAFVRAWEALPLWTSQRALPEAARSRRRAERLGHTAEGLAWSLRALGLGVMPNLRGALRAPGVPVTLVTGALDEKFTALAKEYASPAVRHTTVHGAGHDVGLEAPGALASVLKELGWR